MILHYDRRIEHLSILQNLNAHRTNIKNQIITANTRNNFQLISKIVNTGNNKFLQTNNYVKIIEKINYYILDKKSFYKYEI